MHTLLIDVVGPFSHVSHKGNKYIFVMMEIVNYCWLTATPNETATTIANILVDIFLISYGFATHLLSHRGLNFVSRRLSKLLSIVPGKLLLQITSHKPMVKSNDHTEFSVTNRSFHIVS